MNDFYEMIFKRRSVRRYDAAAPLEDGELTRIEDFAAQMRSLLPEIKTAYKIVKRKETTAKIGEYALLFYSEKKPGYLMNCGYMLEQLDLYLAGIGIGACWYGLGHTAEKSCAGLDFVIMLVFGRAAEPLYRASVSEFDRRDADSMWPGEFDESVKRAALLAPSACNSQPWHVIGGDKALNVRRNCRVKGILAGSRKDFFNSIDMGIFLCFLETALTHAGLSFRRKLFTDAPKSDDGFIDIAKYENVMPETQK